MNASHESPSSARLLRATLLALAVAAVVLVTVVLPAEYGIDPTGVGKRLGLEVLAEPATAEPAPSATLATASPAPSAAQAAQPAANSEGLDAVGQPIKPIDPTPLSDRGGSIRTQSLTVHVPPGKGAEVKAEMQAGAAMVFRWTASDPVAFDMHGDRRDAEEGEYTSYWIERERTQASGSFVAPFEGRHGWYWLNRGTRPVTVTVEATGFQGELFRP